MRKICFAEVCDSPIASGEPSWLRLFYIPKNSTITCNPEYPVPFSAGIFLIVTRRFSLTRSSIYPLLRSEEAARGTPHWRWWVISVFPSLSCFTHRPTLLAPMPIFTFKLCMNIRRRKDNLSVDCDAKTCPVQPFSRTEKWPHDGSKRAVFIVVWGDGWN